MSQVLTNRIQEHSLRLKKTYTLKCRKIGIIFASMTEHAERRMEERNIILFDLLFALNQAAEELCLCKEEGEVLLVDRARNLSIILSISLTEKDFHYFNVITILNDIPVTDDGRLKFYNVSHCITI